MAGIELQYVDIDVAFQSILKPNAYIVTQGPMENTVTEFWRMVWQEQASCIVMLTKTFDFIKVKGVTGEVTFLRIDNSRNYNRLIIYSSRKKHNFTARNLTLTADISMLALTLLLNGYLDTSQIILNVKNVSTQLVSGTLIKM